VATSPLQTIRSLSQYRPFEGGGSSVKEAHEDLVLAAIAEAGGSCKSIEACADAITTLFTVELSELAVAGALNSLVRESRVEHDRGTFALSEAEAARLEDVAAESQAVAEAALAEWRAFLTQNWPLDSEQIQLLTGHLALFLRTVLRRHGAEATMLLYPEAPEAQHLYDEIEEEGFDFLPAIADAQLREIRDTALSEFIRHPTDTQKVYLSQNLNTAYFLTVLTIDPDGAQLVADIAEGQVVYLDTNFLYRLLGVQGPRFVRPAEAILTASQAVGYVMRITPWTLAEFRTSLKRSKEFVEKYPIPPDQYAQIAADSTSDENFVTEYWRRVRSGIKAMDFFEYYEEVETHLNAYGVEVSSQGCTAVDQQTDEITNQMSILARSSHGRYRHPALLEHDVKHRMLVKRLRGQSVRNFSNAGFWFLTHDSVLPRYDHMARESNVELPFCVSAGAWFQIIEAFRPKSQDLEQSLADMLASPYVRYRRNLSQKTAVQIVARVNQFKDGTPELATRVLMNSAALTEIEAAESDEETIERIDSAIVAAAHQAQEDALRAQEIAEQERQRADDESEAARKRAQKAEHEAAMALAVAEAAQRDEVERLKIRSADELRRAEEKAAKELSDREKELMAAIASRDEEVDMAKRSASDAKRRLLFFSAVVGLVIVFVLAKAVAGWGAAWSLLVAVGVICGLLAVIGGWARLHSQ
jgi:adenylate kinase family enzyme